MSDKMERPVWGNRFMLFFICWNLLFQMALALEKYRNPGFWLFQMPHYYFLFYITVFLAPAAVYLTAAGQPPVKMLRLTHISAKNCFLIIVLTLLFIPYNSLLSLAASLLFTNASQSIMGSVNNIPVWLRFVMICCCPAFFEEIVFRGVIGAHFRRVGLLKAAAVTGLFFGIMHLDGQQLLYAWFMGMLFYYFYRVTGSLWASMLAHFITNTFSFFLSLATSGGDGNGLPAGWQDYALAAAFYIVIALASFPLLRWVWRRFRAANPPESGCPQDNTAVFTPAFWAVIGIYAVVFIFQVLGTLFPK